MIDPLPDGYLALGQAVARLAVDISVQEIDEANRRIRSQDDTPVKEEATSQPAWRNFPEDWPRHEIEKGQRTADTLFAKREIAISKLHAALCDGGLTGLVYEDKAFFQLTPSDWRSTVLWRQTIISGVVRASLGEEIARHDERRVMLESVAFDAWLKERLRHRSLAAAAAGDCQAWLEDAMRASPKHSPHRKPYWRKLAEEKFGTSGREFDRLWPKALEETGAEWDRRGAPLKAKK